MAADGANMAENGDKRRRSKGKGSLSKAADGEAAGFNAPRPQLKSSGQFRSRDDSAMATDHYSAVHSGEQASKRRRLLVVRERDLAWDLAEEGETSSMAKRSAREDGDGESAWTSPSHACNQIASPTEGRVLECSEATGASIPANPPGADLAEGRQERLEANERGALTLENPGMVQRQDPGNVSWSTGKQERQSDTALAGSQQQQAQQQQARQQQGSVVQHLISEGGSIAAEIFHANALEEAPGGAQQHRLMVGNPSACQMEELQQGQANDCQVPQARQGMVTRQHAELAHFLSLGHMGGQVPREHTRHGEGEQSMFSAGMWERMKPDEQQACVLEQAVEALRASGVTGCPCAGNLGELKQELASTLERTQASQLQLENALALQHVEGEAALGRANRGEEEQKMFTGDVRKQLRENAQKTEGLEVAVRWLQERSYSQDALEQSLAAVSSEIADARKVLHKVESTLQVNLSDVQEQLRQGEQQTEGLQVAVQWLQAQSYKQDALVEEAIVTQDAIADVRKVLQTNSSQCRDASEGLRTQKQATDLLETAGKELQFGTVQGFDRLAEALQKEQERREQGDRNMQGAWEAYAQRQQLTMETLAGGVAQHGHLLQGFVGAVSLLHINGAEQETALAAMERRMAAMHKGCEEQALLIHALTVHAGAADAKMAELSIRAQAAELDVRGAEDRAEHWAKCADDGFQQQQRRQNRQASCIATNRESCARVEQGLALLRQDTGVDIMELLETQSPQPGRGAPRPHTLRAALRSAYRRGEKGGRVAKKAPILATNMSGTAGVDLTTQGRAAQGTSSNVSSTASVDLATESRAAQGTSSNASCTAGEDLTTKSRAAQGLSSIASGTAGEDLATESRAEQSTSSDLSGTAGVDLPMDWCAAQGTSSNVSGTAGADLTMQGRAAQGTSSSVSGTAGVDLTTQGRATQSTSSSVSGMAGVDLTSQGRAAQSTSSNASCTAGVDLATESGAAQGTSSIA
ncbi:hypothetical protein T484DRAFT_1855467, partial [Baffinella frigidus]